MRSSAKSLLLILPLLVAACASKPAASAPSAANTAQGCKDAIAYSSSINGVSVLVHKDGKTICEDYAADGKPETGYEIWSGTKSFTGIISAIAVKEKLLTLDEPVSATITEWSADPRKSKITIRQLLSLTGGFAGNNAGRAPGYANAIATPATADPGTKFQYGPAPFQVFGALMQRKLAAKGQPADIKAYITSRILEPLDMHPTDWRRTPEGDLIMSQGSVFNAREWIKYGEFVRHEGSVNGKTLVDPKAFRELFIGTPANPAYGVSWWLPKASTAGDVVTALVDLGDHAADLPPDLVVAAGAGDQRLYVIPSCKLTAVRQAAFNPADALTARRDRSHVWSDYRFVRILLDTYCAK